jgi:hypothetical protein
MTRFPLVTLGAVLLSGVLVLGSLTGCAQFGCASNAATPTDAVADFLRDLPEATSPEDICEYVSEGFVVSETELAELKSMQSELPVGDVTFVEGEQMAAYVTVDVLVDGAVQHRFAVIGDDHNGHWTIDLGGVRD